jgi:hypothetical protein
MPWVEDLGLFCSVWCASESRVEISLDNRVVPEIQKYVFTETRISAKGLL